MATPPTFIADDEGTGGWTTTTTPKTTAAFNSAINDIWVTGLIAQFESATYSAPTNTGTAQTFTARGFCETGSHCEIRTHTTVVANALTSQTVSQARSAGTALRYNINVVRFSGSDGIGAVPASEVNEAVPALNITTTADNSAVVVFIGDWNAIDGASRTWLTVNSITPTAGNGFELTYFRVSSSTYTGYIAYYPDVGAAGVKAVGLSAPGGQKAGTVAIEVKGVAGAAAPIPPILTMPARSA